MKHATFLIGSAFAILTTSACATKTVTFRAVGPASQVAGSKAKVMVLSPSKLDEGGTLLGEAPVTVELDQIVGKVVRIEQPGKQSVYWIVTDAAGDQTEVSVSMFDDPGSSGGSNNRVARLLMKSYQALSGKLYGPARELADQAATIDPELAAPHVIKGLSFYQEGNSAEARSAFMKAQALDPEDKDIDALLKMIH